MLECGVQLRYEPAADHLHESHWVVQEAIHRLSAAAVGLPEGSELTPDAIARFRCSPPLSYLMLLTSSCFSSLCCGFASLGASLPACKSRLVEAARPSFPLARSKVCVFEVAFPGFVASKERGKTVACPNDAICDERVPQRPALCTSEHSAMCSWACALVHSRTFATAAKGGGVGVRVMVPVVDMFNHAGDEVRNLLSSRTSACDNCRWVAVGPENNASQEWVMQARPSLAFACALLLCCLHIALVPEHRSSAACVAGSP